MTRADALALLKVLIAAAWADSRISQTEINYLKGLFRRFNLSDHDWIELEPYLENPPAAPEVDALFKDLLTRLATTSGRDQAVRHLEEILRADANITAEEHDFLEEYVSVLQQASTVQLLAGRLQSLFHKRPESPVMHLDEFIRNKIFFKLQRRLATDQIPPKTYRLCLLGGLMGVVAQADGQVAPQELDQIRYHLQHLGEFEPDALDTLMAIIEEEAVRGLDRARLIFEYTGPLGFDQRVELLDMLFGIAVADGGLTHAELEELRGISAGMNLSHRQYIDAKLRAK